MARPIERRFRLSPYAPVAVALALVAAFTIPRLAGAGEGGIGLSSGGFESGGGHLSGGELGVDASAGQNALGDAAGGNIGISGGGLAASDACPTVPGPSSRQGCDLALLSDVDLHVVDQAKSGACHRLTGIEAPSCAVPLADTKVKVFDRSRLDGLVITTLSGGTTTLTKNPDGSLYDDIFESSAANASPRIATFGCVTVASGTCQSGLRSTGDHLVILRWTPPSVDTRVYTGLPYGSSAFTDTDEDGDGDLAKKNLKVVQTIRKDGTVVYSGGSKTVVTGSYLEIVSPDRASWTSPEAGYLYPFAMTADSAWTVELCAALPAGYVIVGVFDEAGVALPTIASLAGTCVTRPVSKGDRKAAAFEVVQVGAPSVSPSLSVGVRTFHEGVTKTKSIAVPGIRTWLTDAAVATVG